MGRSNPFEYYFAFFFCVGFFRSDPVLHHPEIDTVAISAFAQCWLYLSEWLSGPGRSVPADWICGIRRCYPHLQILRQTQNCFLFPDGFSPGGNLICFQRSRFSEYSTFACKASFGTWSRKNGIPCFAAHRNVLLYPFPDWVCFGCALG